MNVRHAKAFLLDAVSIAISACLLAQPADAQTRGSYSDARGKAAGRVVYGDGDDFSIGAVKTRLHGIDAPERSTECNLSGDKGDDCGLRAAQALVTLLGRQVTCIGTGKQDRRRRWIAKCSTRSRPDLGAETVRLGWACAFVEYSKDYVALEEEARAAKRGMWAATGPRMYDLGRAQP